MNVESISPTMSAAVCLHSVIPYPALISLVTLYEAPVVFLSFFRFSSHTFFAITKVCMSPRDTNLRKINIKLKHSI